MAILCLRWRWKNASCNLPDNWCASRVMMIHSNEIQLNMRLTINSVRLVLLNSSCGVLCTFIYRKPILRCTITLTIYTRRNDTLLNLEFACVLSRYSSNICGAWLSSSNILRRRILSFFALSVVTYNLVVARIICVTHSMHTAAWMLRYRDSRDNVAGHVITVVYFI